MQPVRVNKRAVFVLLGLSVLLLCALTYIPTGKENFKSETQSSREEIQIRQEHKVENASKRTERKWNHPKNIKRTENVTVPIQRNEIDESPPDQGKRREFVKNMMLHAWEGYRNYSWGANEVKPILKKPNSQSIFGGNGMPATIVDAADTLWIMDLKDEYKEARDYIKQNMNISTQATGTLSVFETNIRFLGGLLSLYALTNETFYVEKAKSLGLALLPAFKTATGVPKSNLNLATKYASNYGWAGGSSILAEFGSLHLEFVYLSEITNSPIFAKKVHKIREALLKAGTVDGLYPNYINPETGRWNGPHHMSVGALGDSFYEYLIKSWLQSNKKDSTARKMYWDVSKAIREKMVRKSASGLTYVAELRSGRAENKMGHLACFVVGMFALQAVNEKNAQEKAQIMSLAEALGNTCHESYIRTASHIGPEMFYFNNVDDATALHGENGYILRPEVIEGFFYLWRLTGKTMYRDWVWDAIKSIDRYCRVEGGFAGLQNVYEPTKGYDDVQQSFFLAETLKYAYLTFSDSSVIDLEKWVFNTEAHPLPVMNMAITSNDQNNDLNNDQNNALP